MSEAEYTQFQQDLYSQMDPQSNEGTEIRVVMLGESVISSSTANKAPNETEGDSSGVGIVQVRKAGSSTGTNLETKAVNSRLRCSVRVCLEDRFNMLESEGIKDQKAQDFSNNPVTLIHHPSQHIKTQHNKWATEGSTDTRTLQFPYPCNSLFSSVGSSQAQVIAAEYFGCSTPMREETKLQKMSLSRGFSFCYQKEWESAKLSSGSQHKLVPKQVCNNIEDALGKQVIKQQIQSPQGQVDTGMESNLLSKFQKLEEEQAIKETNRVAWPLTQYKDEPTLSNTSTALSQSKERKNLLERVRRRKIRVCCDELNVLVPFCNVGTDKATTLKWTVTFLKYIHKHHGDSMRKEFESIYCEKQIRCIKSFSGNPKHHLTAGCPVTPL